MRNLTEKPEPSLQSPAAQSSRFLIVLSYLVCALIWGTTWYAIRVCIGAGGYAVFPAVALRFTISAAVLLLIWLFAAKKIAVPPLATIKWLSLAGVLSGLGYGLLYVAEERLSGGLTAVISATGPLIASLIAMVTRTEKPSRATIFGSCLAFFGVAIVFHDQCRVSLAQAWSVGILLLNCTLSSSSNVVMKRQSHGVPALAVNTIFFTAAAVLSWLLACATGQPALPNPLPAVPTAALIYLTLFGTLCTFAAFFYLLKHVRLSTAMTLAFVTPLVALVVDAFFEKQAVLTGETYLGMAVVLVGVVVTATLKMRGDRS